MLARLATDPPVSEPQASARCSTPSCPASARSGRCWSATPRAGCCCAGSPTRTTGTCPAASSRSTSRRRAAVAREVEEELGLTHRCRRPAAHRLAAAVGRLGRRGVPGLRRRRPRPVRARGRRAAGRGRSGPRSSAPLEEVRDALRRLHRPADRVGAGLARGAGRSGVHRVRPGLTPRRVGANARKAPAESARTHEKPPPSRRERTESPRVARTPEPVESARTHGIQGGTSRAGRSRHDAKPAFAPTRRGSNVRSRRLGGIEACVRADSTGFKRAFAPTRRWVRTGRRRAPGGP